MDGLSTAAREWTPGGGTLGQQPSNNSNNSNDGWRAESDLKATAIKEFLPGMGWTAGVSSSSSQVDTNINPYATQGYTAEQTTEPVAVEEPGLPSTIPAGPTPPPFRCLHSLGMSDDLWRQHRQWQLECIRQLEPTDPRHKAVPAPYCNPWPLDYEQSPRSSFGYPCATFQVASQVDGHLYCLRRFDSVKSVNSKIAAAVAEQWAGFEHPNLVGLHHAFVAQRAVFFVHNYVPGVVPLRERLVGSPVTEPVLWSAICQWVGLIRRVHQARLAVRTLDARHVLLQMDSLRVRWYINCIGVSDALEWESRKSVESLQMDDIRKLGPIDFEFGDWNRDYSKQ